MSASVNPLIWLSLTSYRVDGQQRSTQQRKQRCRHRNKRWRHKVVTCRWRHVDVDTSLAVQSLAERTRMRRDCLLCSLWSPALVCRSALRATVVEMTTTTTNYRRLDYDYDDVRCATITSHIDPVPGPLHVSPSLSAPAPLANCCSKSSSVDRFSTRSASSVSTSWSLDRSRLLKTNLTLYC